MRRALLVLAVACSALAGASVVPNRPQVYPQVESVALRFPVPRDPDLRAPEPEPSVPRTIQPRPSRKRSAGRAVTPKPAQTSTAPRTGWLTAAALARLRACESGGNYANKSNRSFRGAYQFHRGTWNGVWTRHGRPDLVGIDPADARPADQDMAARWLFSERGPGPWPGCSQKNPGWWRK